MKKRWKVCDNDGRDRACSFTHKKGDGWETDSGYFTYGLSYEMAKYICDILNKYGDPKKELKLKWQSNDPFPLGHKFDDEDISE